MHCRRLAIGHDAMLSLENLLIHPMKGNLLSEYVFLPNRRFVLTGKERRREG